MIIDNDVQKEAEFFSAADNDATRKVAWSSISVFQKRIAEEINVAALARKHFKDDPPKRALTLACGDMKGEYGFFKSLRAERVDAFDVSSGQRDKFFSSVYDGGIDVDYRIGDANEITIEPGVYDVVYMQHSLHHITEVERLLFQISRGLSNRGIFVLNDYIGPSFLQRTERQRELTNRIWKRLPPRLRMSARGKIFEKPHIPQKESLSPYEAVRSGAILPALRRAFLAKAELQLAGLLFPMINGFAQNYGEDEELLLSVLWEIDQYMIQQGAVEPNFIVGVYMPA